MSQLKVLFAGPGSSASALRAQLEARSDVAVAATPVSNVAAIAAVQRTDPDVVFLDLDTPHLDACMLLERLSTRSRPPVIFLTTRDEAVLHAFEVLAVDYQLKPDDPATVNAILERAQRRGEEQGFARVRQALVHPGAAAAPGCNGYARRLLVRRGSRARFIMTCDLDWIEAVGNGVRLHTGNEAHLMNARIGELERRLDPTQFMRIHRSTIVNLDRIARIEPCGGSDYQVVLQDDTMLRVSRGCRDRLLRDTI